MANPIYTQYIHSPAGELIAGVHKDELCLLDWRYRKKRPQIDQRIQLGLDADFLEERHEIHDAVVEQIDAYFHQDISRIEVPFKMVGTVFQQEVWTQLLDIPYGQTISYLELSKRLSSPKAVRAVASANGANALAIIVPCHRVIGQNGDLTGYAGGLRAKKRLLNLEGYPASSQLELF